MDFRPVGWVRSTRAAPGGRGHGWDREITSVELDPARFGVRALAGLEDFSHVEVVFFFDRVDPGLIEYGCRRPAAREDWPEVGIFASRYSHRPNRIGVTRCRLRGISGLTLDVSGLDAIDGTPVLDIKPWMAEQGPRGEVRQPAWSRELMAGYWHGGPNSRNCAPGPLIQVRKRRARSDNLCESLLGDALSERVIRGRRHPA